MVFTRKLLLFLLLLSILLLIFPFGEAQSPSCVSGLIVELNAYERKEMNNELFLQKSRHQPTDPEGYMKQGDTLYVKRINAEVNATCLQDYSESRIVAIQFQRPQSDKWGEDIRITLTVTNSSIKNYSIELNDTRFGVGAKYNDSLGNQLAIPAKTLDEAGSWGIRLFYDNQEKYSYKFMILNNNSFSNIFLIPNRIEVEPRVSVSILDANKEIVNVTKNGIEESTAASIKSMRVGTGVAIFVGLATVAVTIYFTRKYHKEALTANKAFHKEQLESGSKFHKEELELTKVFHNEQLEVVIKTHEEQLQEARKLVEEGQLSLLQSLYTELNTISNSGNKLKVMTKEYLLKGNLEWFKETFEKTEVVPIHDIWSANMSDYLNHLPGVVKSIEITDLKKLLILINQKIALINNYTAILRKEMLKEDSRVNVSASHKNIIKVIDETIELVNNAKTFLEENFDFK